MKKIIVFTLAVISIISLYAIEVPVTGEQQMQSSITMLPAPIELENEIDPEAYIIGVGDQFIVEKMKDKSIYTLPVLPTGVISIPGVANIKIGGMTLQRATEEIRNVAGPYSNVSLYDIKKIRIPVSGAVNNSGIYTISAAMRLSDLLTQLPLSSLAKDHAIQITSKEGVEVVNIYDFYLEGDISQNPYLHAGESIFIPFADLQTECVEVLGPVIFKGVYSQSPEDVVPTSYVRTIADRGIRPFIPGESLMSFVNRKVQISDAVDYEEIMIYRDHKQIYVPISDVNTFKLQAKDKIEFITLSNIMVSGHVVKPGTYGFIPGHTYMDYISMAGGVNYKGSDKAAIIIRGDKKIRNPEDVEMERGDIILVKRSAEDILIGETSILYFISMIASIASTVITAFIAAGSL